MPGKVIVASTPEQIPLGPVDNKITAVYWDICGLAQPIRYALALAGADFVDVRIEPGDANLPSYKQMWFSKKPNVGEACPFPNLPYLLDEGGVALPQSNAILRYIGRKYGLMGDDPLAVDLVLDQTSDFDAESTRRSYGGGLPALKEYCEKDLGARLAEWAKYLGEKPFMTGDTCTVADIKLYETLRKIRIIETEVGTTSVLAGQPKLCAFLARVEAIPAIAAYMASDQHLERPLNNPHAQFR